MTTDRPDKPDEGRIEAPLEAPASKLIEPFVEFARAQSTGGFVLIGVTLGAIIIASSSLGAAYEELRHLEIGIRVGDFAFDKSLLHWANDGLMAVYFFLLGLEIKRELLAGQLADRRLATTVIAAAAGGMIVPALCYFAINGGTGYGGGWGIPVATDTAFALAILVLLRRHVPASVRAFLVGLAIIDDLGAIAVIALVYTEGLDAQYLVATAGLLLLGMLCNTSGVRHPLVYGLLGLAVWLTIVQSGIHGTIAGVLMAGLAPVRPVVRQGKFVELVDRKIRDFRQSLSRHEDPGTAMLESADQQSTAEEIRDAAVMVTTPIRRWERALDTPVNLLVLPVFALLNAGIAVDAGSLQLIAEHPVTLGIAAGLVVGKPVGVFLTTFLAVRLGLCDLPKGMSYSHLAGVGLLAGIGFTMSVFISGLAFADGSDELLAAKGGILLSSFIAAIAAMLWLRAFSIRQA